jgi:hypothetical protein
MLLLLSLPRALAAARPGCALQRSPIFERWFSGWLVLAECTLSNTCLFLGVNHAIDEMISNIPVYRMLMLPM